MINASGLLPVPVVATHNPLARQPEDEERVRLQEQALPPVEESSAPDASADRRRPRMDAEELRAESATNPEPGSLIDSYA